MKKNLIAVVVLLIVVALGARAFVALFGYQVLEKLKVNKQSELSFTYEWLSSDFSGQLIIHDVVLTPFRLKRSIEIERLVLDYGDYFNLLLGLPELKRGWFGRLSALSAKNAVIPLEGRGLDQWMALEMDPSWQTVFGIYACGNRDRIGHDELKAMGIDQIKAEMSLEIDRTEVPGSVFTRVDSTLGEMGQVRIALEWLADSFSEHLGHWSLPDLAMRSAKIEHIEKGYFRRLSNFCATETGLDRAAFASVAASQWRQAMSGLGAVVGDSSEQLYRDYLRLGGAISLQLNSDPPYRLGNFRELTGTNLTERFSLSAALNDNSAAPMSIRLKPGLFVDQAAAKEQEASVEKQVAPESVKQQIAASPSFKKTPLTELEKYMGRKIRVQAVSGKIFTGTLKQSSENSVKIAQSLQKGEVVYNVAVDEIAVVEIWR